MPGALCSRFYGFERVTYRSVLLRRPSDCPNLASSCVPCRRTTGLSRSTGCLRTLRAPLPSVGSGLLLPLVPPLLLPLVPTVLLHLVPPFLLPLQPSLVLPLRSLLRRSKRDRSVAYRLERAGTATRSYDRKRARNVCRTCGEVQSVETSHSKYKGYLYCERNAAGESLAVWRASLDGGEPLDVQGVLVLPNNGDLDKVNRHARLALSSKPPNLCLML